jgi:aminoglycoside phosphotransferase (APT) family kinase protein
VQEVERGVAEATNLTLASLKAAIIRRFPEHRQGRFSLLTAGWDCIAVDVDDRLIFKFPRDDDARQALATEASLLAVVRPRLTIPVPDLALFSEPTQFSRHGKLPGEHLETPQYDRLPEPARQQLAVDMALFYAQLHSLPAGVMEAAGARPIGSWLPPEQILRRAWPVLPEELRPFAEQTIAAWQGLPPDPYGTIYGFFDGHGWNMAFDHDAQRLNGIYDFGDSGFGDLHQEFIYSNFISRDLTARIDAEYEALTGQALDRERIELLSGILRLSELAEYADDPQLAPAKVRTVAEWAVG